MRQFETGATRDDNTEKPDYRGFISPTALQAFGAYMHTHRKQADGTLRASDNWKKGIPIPAYVESWIRHTVDFWAAYERQDWTTCRELACATWFNVQGFLHEELKRERTTQDIKVDEALCTKDRPCVSCRLQIERQHWPIEGLPG